MMKCCPPARGCNSAPCFAQPCQRLCAQRLTNNHEVIERMDFWWDRFNATPFYKVRDRRSAHKKFVRFREEAFKYEKTYEQIFDKRGQVSFK